jgi:ATP-binding cassette subfamily B protein
VIDGSRGTVRQFRQDRSVTQHRLATGTLRRIAAYARPYRRQLSLFLALILVDAALSASVPLILKHLIDDGILGDRPTLVTALALTVAGIAVVQAGLSLVQRWCSARIGEGLVFDLRTQVFEHVQRMPLAFFSRTQTGALVSRLNTDVQGAQQAFTSTLSTVVSNIATVVMVVTAMLVLSWQITLLALVLVPLFLLPARLAGGRLQAITRERYDLTASMGQTMQERLNVAGALLVKVFGRPGEEAAGFAGRAARVRDIGVTQAMVARVLMVSLGLLASLATALVYGVGGAFAISGALEVGTLVALTAYLQRLYGPLTSLSNLQVDVMTTLVSFERVLEVLDLQPTVADRPGAVDLDATRPLAVSFHRVAFAYPSAAEVSLASLESVATLSDDAGAPVLRDVSFTAEPGQLVALVGPSGAGKTTITALVSRLYDPTEGTVRVGGADVRDLTQASLRSAVGVVTQDAHMFHDTIRANLLYARPDATDAELEAACRAARIWDVVAGMPAGLDTVIGDRGYRLSGGEKQRLAIARLLLKSPSVVVLDEATAHLDSESEAAVQEALRTALVGRTSLVVAHRLSTVRDADQILVVDEGRIVERGTHEALLARGGLYADLHRTQFAAQEDPLPAAA